MAIRYLSGINVDSNTLFVDSTNNRVGIGTASPVAKLDVEGTASFNFANNSSGITFSRQTIGQLGSIINSGSDILYQGTGSVFINADSDSNSTSTGREVRLGNRGVAYMTLTGAGNVGIGTTAPGSLLDVTGPAGVSGSNLFTIQKSGGYGSTDFYQYYNSSSDYGINIGLGVSSAVNGRAGIIIRSTTGGSGTLVFNTTSTERMRINSGGNVLIGTTTDAGYKLDVNGDVRGDSFRAQNSTTTGTTTLSYSDQFKKVWTTLTSFSFTGAGVYYFNLVFQTDNGFTYDLTATTSRDELWRNYGTLRDNSYLNVESDGDFETYAVGDVQIISNDMYLDAAPTAFKSATTTASGINGTSPWAYFIVRYAIYIPTYAGDTNGFFKVHLTTYGYDGNAPLFINA